MRLYNRKDTVLVVGGITTFHILVCGLCIFWIKKFLLQTYDPSVYFLLFIFIAILVICDVLLYRVQGVKRFLVRCRIDVKGIHCRFLWLQKWSVLWDEVCIFGITGYTSMSGMGVIFFSTDPDEKFHRDKVTEISDKRIVFEAEPQIWEKVSMYLPEEMSVILSKSIRDRFDMYHRVGKKKGQG